MFTRAKILCALAATVLVLAATLPAAASIDPIELFGTGLNALNDTSADTIINGTGYNSSGQFGGTIADGYTYVGQNTILLTAFALNTITPPGGTLQDIGTGSAYGQLTGLVAIQCLTSSFSNGSFTQTFGAVSLTASTGGVQNGQLIGAMSTAATAAMSSWASGTLVGLYDGSPSAFNRQGTSLNTDVQTAVGGTSFLQLGFAGSGSIAAGTGWVVSVPSNNLAAVATIPSPGNGGTVNYGLNSLALTAYSGDFRMGAPSTLNPSADVTLNGSSNLLGTGGVQTPFEAFDNADVVLDFVPEPASLAVWAGAFLIGGVLLRRRLCRS